MILHILNRKSYQDKLFLLSIFLLLLGTIACKNHKGAGTDNQVTDNDAYYNTPQLKEITANIKTDPANALLYFKRGILLHQAKNDTLSIKDFKQAIKLDSTKSEYFSAIGDIYFEHKDISGALEYIKRAIAINPKDVKAHLKIAKALLYSANYQECITEANIALRQDVYNPEGYFLKAMVYKLTGDTAQAIGNFETAIQVAPDYKDAIIQLGLLYSAKKSPLAMKYLDNAYTVDSTDVFPVFAKGVYYQNNNEFEKAKELYRLCILKNMRYIDAYFNMGYILMHQDSVEKAWRQYDLITKMDKLNPTAYFDRGVCEEHMNKMDAAITDYKQSVILDTTYLSPRDALKRLKIKFP